MITVYSIPNCPNCKRLEVILRSKGILNYEKRMFNPDNDDDVAEMSMLGIYTAQFPVVIINGERIPAMPVQQYARLLDELIESGQVKRG